MSMDNRILRELARLREEGHRGHRHGERWKPDATYIGLVGEAEFARQTGLPLDTSWRPGGDDGWDFITSVGTVDIKTAKVPRFLFLKTNAEKFAELYVLAGYSEQDDQATLLGYATLDELLQAPIQQTDYTSNRAIARTDLHHIEQLLSVIRRFGG